MTHRPFTLLAAVALALSGANARSGDIAQIRQTGTGNLATLEQTASNGNNRITLLQQDQRAWSEVLANTALLTQHAVDHATIDLHQEGVGHDTTIAQHDGSSLQATVVSAGGSVDGHWIQVDQSGFDASAGVEVRGISNIVNVAQLALGGGISADIAQYGDGHRATVAQAGSALSATIRQDGAAFEPGTLGTNHATIRQGR